MGGHQAAVGSGRHTRQGAPPRGWQQLPQTLWGHHRAKVKFRLAMSKEKTLPSPPKKPAVTFTLSVDTTQQTLVYSKGGVTIIMTATFSSPRKEDLTPTSIAPQLPCPRH